MLFEVNSRTAHTEIGLWISYNFLYFNRNYYYMKLGILGNRFFHDYDFIKRRILELFDIEVIDTIICRDTSGVDALVKRFADDFNLKKDIKKPDWEKHEKEAPSICNQEIVDSSDCIFAFPSKSSGGT